MSPGSILVGTSGYSFPDWVGPFYPPGMKSSDFLAFYAQHFNGVEVNSTYYRVPHPRVLDMMQRKTPPGFRFVVKLNQAMTHENSNDPNLYRDFHAILEPLKAAGKYDALLAQFPWSFRKTQENVDHLRRLRDYFPGEPLFAEFRNRSWVTPQLEGDLTALDVGYCAVDEPKLEGLMPPITLRTSADAYVRFHGRNTAEWWGGGPLRYDYDYKENELKEWMGRVTQLAEQARRTYLFFNNCHAGQAARNAKLMEELLRRANPLL